MSRWVDLVYELVRKNLKVRYSGFLPGLFWSFFFPFLTVGIFYIVFSIVLKVKVEEAPFLLYLMTSIFTWQFFRDSLTASVTSLFDNKNLIRESSFPHWLIPLSIIFTNMINFIPSLFVTVIVSLLVLKGLPLAIIFLPLVMFAHICLITGLSVALSILYVRWRGIKHALEACLAVLFYLTPAFYSIRLIKAASPSLLYNLYTYNPFTGMLNLYRIVLLKGFYAAIKGDVGFSAVFIVPAGFSIAALILGFFYYNKKRKTINDFLSY
jgi:ABC-2 type transport system permease protein